MTDERRYDDSRGLVCFDCSREMVGEPYGAANLPAILPAGAECSRCGETLADGWRASTLADDGSRD